MRGNDRSRSSSCIARVPSGAWAVGVSGGADSVGLLLLLRARPDLQLHVAHLDHETRGGDSAQDARFVQSLCQAWKLPCTILRRSQIEPTLGRLPANPSARFRAARLACFGKVIAEHRLLGVILAHHVDDQSETILHRLLRGSSFGGLIGMSAQTRVGGLLIVRPLLDVRRDRLRRLLTESHQPWREDASNQSREYVRNRLRMLLQDYRELNSALLDLGSTCPRMRDWTRRVAPHLDAEFAAATLARLPGVVARESARQWLLDRGASSGDLDSASLDRLIAMASDAATPARQQFAGGLVVRRRGARILAH